MEKKEKMKPAGDVSGSDDDVSGDGSIENTLIKMTVTELSKSLQQIFSTVDYVIFFVMLLICALIGVYFGLIDKHGNRSSVDYLMGGRTMSVFPICLSLIAR